MFDTEGKFAFSKTDSTSKGVDWLSLLAPSHANAIKEELTKMKAEGYVPIALRALYLYFLGLRSRLQWLIITIMAFVITDLIVFTIYKAVGQLSSLLGKLSYSYSIIVASSICPYENN